MLGVLFYKLEGGVSTASLNFFYAVLLLIEDYSNLDTCKYIFFQKSTIPPVRLCLMRYLLPAIFFSEI